MQLVIFLNMEDIRCLAEGVSDTSTVGELIFRALRLRQMSGAEGQEVFVLCNETEARELLRHAQSQCQQTVNKILRAFDLAGVIP
ncbi:MAG: hypothetical protein ACREP3_19270 [Candidatus Binatia bacterium]